MAPPLDLMGRRFGKLTVLRRGERVKWGKWQSSWICRCDCGTIVSVPQNRLPHREWVPKCHRVEACEACRAHPCEICGAPIPARATSRTCSPECKRERKRRYQLAYYHERRAKDPDFRLAQRERARERYRALSPEEKRAANAARYRREREQIGPEEMRRRERDGYAKRMEDPAYRERHRDKGRAWREKNRARARRYYREYARRRRLAAATRELQEIMSDLGAEMEERNDGES